MSSQQVYQTLKSLSLKDLRQLNLEFGHPTTNNKPALIGRLMTGPNQRGGAKKVALNKSYGGFRLSDKGALLYKRYLYNYESDDDIEYDPDNDYVDFDPRDDKSLRYDYALIKTIEELGKEASGDMSDLQIEEVPDEYFMHDAWEINEYDGYESIKLNKDLLELKKLKKEYEKLKTEHEKLKKTVGQPHSLI